jgi:hypothetical protein
MKEILFWQRERENVWTRPSYSVFGGHFILCRELQDAWTFKRPCKRPGLGNFILCRELQDAWTETQSLRAHR